MKEKKGFRSLAIGLIAAGTAIAIAVTGSSPAQGAFPGKNGRIIAEESGDIYSINKKTGAARNLTPEGTSPKDPAGSPNGRLIVMATSEGLALMRRDGSNYRLIDPPARGFADGSHPSFSADGKWIVFTNSAGIAKVRKDGTVFSQLTNSEHDSDPVFHPLKNLIFFERDDPESGNDDIYRMKADGSRVRAVTSTGNKDEDDPQFTPDGKKIVVSSDKNNGPEQIVIMKTDGTKRKSLTNNNKDSDEPAVSPDGRLIVFRESPMHPPRGFEGDTYTIRVNGKNKREIPIDGLIDTLSDYDWLVR